MPNFDSDILKTITDTTRAVIYSKEISTCSLENHLRGLFVATLFEKKYGKGLVGLVEHEHIDIRLPKSRRRKVRDLVLAPRNNLAEVFAVGEFKFFKDNKRGLNYQFPMGARLSDLHYLQNLAVESGVFTFFLDVTLQSKLVGNDCYNSLRDFNIEIITQVEQGIGPEILMKQKSYFRAAEDRTPRTQKRELWGNCLFPCMDLDPKINGAVKHLRGPVIIRKPDKDTGLIAIGIRHSHTGAKKPNQIIPYRQLPHNPDAAFCLAVFGKNGELQATTDTVI